MSLFSRLFSPRRNLKKESTPAKLIKNNGPNSFTTFSVEKDQIRVLLFRECDWRGRKLLFDSSSVQKVAMDTQNSGSRIRRDSKELIVEISNGFGYQCKRPNQDITILGETVFGSVAMASRSHTFKVHLLKEPQRLMLTKVAHAPRSEARKRQISDHSLDDSSSSSISDYYNYSSFDSKSDSLDKGLHRVTTQEDSGFSRESSNLTNSEWLKHSIGNCDCVSYCPMRYSGISLKLIGSDPGNSSNSLAPSNTSGGSLSSLRRRWNRSIDMSMNLNKYSVPSSQVDSGFSNPELLPIQSSVGKRTKLGIALLIPIEENQQSEMEGFLLERMSLLINILAQLQYSTELAYLRKDKFVQSMLEASQQASQSIYDLISASRLNTPVWLSLTSNTSNTTVVSEISFKFIQDLSHLLEDVDTKHTNFFISTLLTAVLTHHLGWVPTVFSDHPTLMHNDKLLSELAQNHPYNPFWAQQNDLRGALSFPLKTSRTIVIGQSESLINKILSLLSYFIRCGQVIIKKQEMEHLENEDEIISEIVEKQQKESADETDFYSQIRQFNQSEPIGTSSTSGSSVTLSKSKTVLSLKTFSITENLPNLNEKKLCDEFSLDTFSRHNYDTNNKSTGLKKTKSVAAKLKDALCLDGSIYINNDSYENNNHFGLFKRTNLSKSSQYLTNFEDNVLLWNESGKSLAAKSDLEKQMSSVDLKNILNKSEPNLQRGTYLKQNLLHSGTPKDKDERVVFVLGENEKLIDIKNHDKISFCDEDWCDKENINTDNPIILVDDFHVEKTFVDKNLNYINERKKTDLVIGNNDSQILIVQTASANLENNLQINHESFPRSVSVPEVILTTESVRTKRSKDAVDLIRRWFSDSEILIRENKNYDEGDKIVTVAQKSYENINYRTNSEILNDCRTKSEFFNDLSENSSMISNSDCFHDSIKVDKKDYLSVGIDIPILKTIDIGGSKETNLAKSMFGGLNDHYIPEMVLQGLSQVNSGWEAKLKKDLILEAHATDLNNDITESVCIVANADTWEVLLISSHTVVVDKAMSGVGIHVDMSPLVANIMETTHHLCKLDMPPQMCLNHIESKLSELCVRSQALAELLLSSEFLDMATLTSTLDLDPNDVPLLLSVASTHTPQVTREYGLSFQ